MTSYELECFDKYCDNIKLDHLRSLTLTDLGRPKVNKSPEVHPRARILMLAAYANIFV